MAKVVPIDEEQEKLEKAYQAGYEFAESSGILKQIKEMWDEFEKKAKSQAALSQADEDTFLDGASNAVADMVDSEIVLLDDEGEDE